MEDFAVNPFHISLLLSEISSREAASGIRRTSRIFRYGAEWYAGSSPRLLIEAERKI